LVDIEGESGFTELEELCEFNSDSQKEREFHSRD
jgi:hypothetical protein